jgi:K+-sensing histidine kinase KdpD
MQPPTSTPTDLDGSTLHLFVQRARKALGHDLRTPLGTIVNYASVLEEDPAPEVTNVRELTQRIRGHAMHAAEMLQLLLDALLIAAQAPAPRAIDATALVESIVAEMEGGTTLRVEAAPASDELHAAEFDPAVVAYAWRAFLDLEKTVFPRLPREARIDRSRDGSHATITLRFGAAAATQAVELDPFLRRDGVDVPPPRRLALQLARDLVVARGGTLEMLGRAAGDAGIRLGFAP